MKLCKNLLTQWPPLQGNARPCSKCSSEIVQGSWATTTAVPIKLLAVQGGEGAPWHKPTDRPVTASPGAIHVELHDAQARIDQSDDPFQADCVLLIVAVVLRSAVVRRREEAEKSVRLVADTGGEEQPITRSNSVPHPLTP